MHNRRFVVAAIAGLGLLAAGCSSAQPGSGSAPATTPPPSVTLTVATGIPGTYLTDGSGRALYMWENDPEGQSKCTGACAIAWPPLSYTRSVQAGAGVDSSLIGRTTRPDGTTQVTYGGWPLYYFAPDVRPGQLSGQGDTGFGAVWWVISPQGKPLPSEPLATTSAG